MTKWIVGCGLCIAMALQTGCTTYGVSNEAWLQMSPEQQKVTMETYREQQQANAAIRLERQQAARLRQERLLLEAFEQRCIQVEIGGGYILSRGQYHRYTPQVIQLHDNERKQIHLHLADRSTVTCFVQYTQGTLVFDAPQHPNGSYPSIAIPESPLWQKGYHIPKFNMGHRNSFRARDLAITVRMIPSHK